jgi:hypothetical protein
MYKTLRCTKLGLASGQELPFLDYVPEFWHHRQTIRDYVEKELAA